MDTKFTDLLGSRPYGVVRYLCHHIKVGQAEAIASAAAYLAGALPKKSVLIPAPSHEGFATVTAKLCKAIQKEADRKGIQVRVVDAIVGDKRESLYQLKKRGVNISAVRLRFSFRNDTVEASVRDFRKKGYRVFFVDNVVDTGTTVRACLEVIPDASILAVGDTGAWKTP